MAYTYTYPENKLQIIDGQLRPVATIPTDLVLVIERAQKGPSNTLYLVDDLTTAKYIYGDKSPLLNLANRARAGRAQNIALFRIGGGAHTYDNIFGPATSLRLTEESVSAAKNLKVYIGPEPQNDTRQCIIIFEGDRIIYSNVLGGEIRSSKVAVDGFDKLTNTLRVGSVKNPVPFTEIKNNIGGDADSTATIKEDTYETENHLMVDASTISGYDASKVDLKSIRLFKQSGGEEIPVIAIEGENLIIKKSSDPSPDVNNSDPVDVKFVKKLETTDVDALNIQYTEGKDSMNASYQELYEALDDALDQLELLPTKALLVGDWFNVPNIAEGSTAPNKLTYVKKGEDADGYPTYDWSDHKYVYQWTDPTGLTKKTTTEISKADLDVNGQPIIVDRYNEVDFTHRLGMFAQSKLGDGDYLNVIIGAQGPANGSPRALNEWVGASPVRDLQGNIIENGTGLLGHRLMVGTVDYKGGYFATDNGFVDGEVLTDITGFPIDLGKHISVVVSQVAAASATSPNVVTSAAAAYAGLVSNLQPGDSTTNQVIDNMILVADIKESKRKELSRSGYVVFLDKPKGLACYSGDLATRDNSDFNYISTAMTISAISRAITDTVDPFIGKGVDFVSLTAMKTQLTTVLANAQKAGWMISFDFRIKRDGPNTLLIPFVIEAKDELRAVSNVVRLTRSDLTIEV